MSIASEITRLQGVKSDILQAIADKGVTVPAGSALDDCPALIADIPSGGGPDLPDNYQRLISITNGTGADSAINLSSYSFSLNVKTSDNIKFSFTLGSAINGSNPEIDLIDNYPSRSLGFLLDFNFWYISNSPLYSNVQNALVYMQKCSSYIVEQEGGKIRVNGTEYTISTNEGDNDQTITKLFSISGNNPQNIFIHGIEVIDEDENYKYNLVPALNKTTNTKGLFDTVSSTFIELSNYQS